MTAAGPSEPAPGAAVTPASFPPPSAVAASPPSAFPPPPPGPGVRPPFVAPPTDGARQRRWLAIGLASAAALVCCVGSLFGLGGLVVLGNQMIENQARGVVTDYLSAIRDEEYGEAYALLCESEQAHASLSEFSRSLANEPALASFQVREPHSADRLTVDATLRYESGGSDDVRFVIEQERSTGELRVCGQEG